MKSLYCNCVHVLATHIATHVSYSTNLNNNYYTVLVYMYTCILDIIVTIEATARHTYVQH